VIVNQEQEPLSPVLRPDSMAFFSRFTTLLVGTTSHELKKPITICCAALLASSALGFTNDSPWSPYIKGPYIKGSFNINPPTAEQVYLRGYEDGYSLGYHGAWCGVRFFDKFSEAYWKGEGRGRRDGRRDAEIDSRKFVYADAERGSARKRPWHPPLLPDSDDSHLPFGLEPFVFTDE
jgi:hypothetical protein